MSKFGRDQEDFGGCAEALELANAAPLALETM